MFSKYCNCSFHATKCSSETSLLVKRLSGGVHVVELLKNIKFRPVGLKNTAEADAPQCGNNNT